jgi:hypothetical protein
MIEATVRYIEPTINIFIQKRVLVNTNTKSEALEILKNLYGNDASFIFKK